VLGVSEVSELVRMCQRELGMVWKYVIFIACACYSEQKNCFTKGQILLVS
jgi:hypothetical protein